MRALRIYVCLTYRSTQHASRSCRNEVWSFGRVRVKHQRLFEAKCAPVKKPICVSLQDRKISSSDLTGDLWYFCQQPGSLSL